MSREQDKVIAEWLGMCRESFGKWWFNKNGAFAKGNCGVLAAAKFNQPVSEKYRFNDDGSVKWEECNGLWYTDIIPRWSTSDAAAIELLPVLVERGWDFKLESFRCGIRCLIIKVGGGYIGDDLAYRPTISAAICAAVLQLIEREAAR